MTMVELGAQRWPRVSVVRGDVSWSRLALYMDGHEVRLEDGQGAVVDAFTIAADADGNRAVERLDAKAYRMLGEDGLARVVTKKGCNCGG